MSNERWSSNQKLEVKEIVARQMQIDNTHIKSFYAYGSLDEAVDSFNCDQGQGPEAIAIIYLDSEITILYACGCKQDAEDRKKDAEEATRKFLGRFAAYIHNCVHFNRLTLLEKVVGKPQKDKTNEQEHEQDHPLERIKHDAGMNLETIRIKLLIWLVFLFLMPSLYDVLVCRRAGYNMEWIFILMGIDTDKCKSTPPLHRVGIIMVGVTGCLCLMQIFIAKKLMVNSETVHYQSTSLTKRARTTPGQKTEKSLNIGKTWYRIVFCLYYFLFKLWQMYVVKPLAPGLMYANINAFESSPILEHAGMFVVGVAVNTVQGIIVAFVIIGRDTGEWKVAAETAIMLIPISLIAMDNFFSPSLRVQAQIDLTIEQELEKKAGKEKAKQAVEVLQRMKERFSFAITDEELEILQEVLDGSDGSDVKFRVTVPSSTHTMTISYRLPGPEINWIALDLSNGKEEDRLKEYRSCIIVTYVLVAFLVSRWILTLFVTWSG